MAQNVKCVFCFKTIDGERELYDGRSGKSRETTAKFFKFLQRHLNNVFHHVNQESPASLLITGYDASERSSFGMDSCSDCNQLMIHFLDLYNQLKVLELKVNYAMHSLTMVMSSATKVSSRVKAFNDSLKTTGSIEEEEIKLTGIHDFRKEFIKKCTEFYCGLLPRVTLDKNKTNPIKLEKFNEKTSLISSTHLASLDKDCKVTSVDVMPSPDSVISLLLIAALANNVLQLLSSSFNRNFKQYVQSVQSHSNAQNVTEPEIVVIDDEQENDLNSEPCQSDTDYRSPGLCSEEECETVLAHDDRCKPIEIISAEANTSASNASDSKRKVFRARKSFLCSECSKSFTTPSALLSHQHTSHIQNDPLGMTEEIIQDYSNSQLKVNRRRITERQKFLIARTHSKASSVFIESKEPYDPSMKTVPEYLSPVQKHLTTALLLEPQFSCKFDNCSKKFVFKEHLESHLTLHGEFLCSLCSHVVDYAPKLAEHVLTKHCTIISTYDKVGTFVTCCMPTCASVSPLIEFHHKYYVFHYLTEHLNLDVGSIGCPICYISSRHLNLKHFQNYHDIANMKSEDVRYCELCPAFFVTSKKLSLHMFAYHNQALTSCPDCKRMLRRNGFTDHYKHCKGRNRDWFQHRCSFPNCDKTFQNLAGLVSHKMSCEFNAGGLWHDCSKCKKRFRRKYQLKQHLMFHQRETEMDKSRKIRRKVSRSVKRSSFVCQFCGLKYADANSLKIHVNKPCSVLLSTPSFLFGHPNLIPDDTCETNDGNNYIIDEGPNSQIDFEVDDGNTSFITGNSTSPEKILACDEEELKAVRVSLESNSCSSFETTSANSITSSPNVSGDAYSLKVHIIKPCSGLLYTPSTLLDHQHLTPNDTFETNGNNDDTIGKVHDSQIAAEPDGGTHIQSPEPILECEEEEFKAVPVPSKLNSCNSIGVSSAEASSLTFKDNNRRVLRVRKRYLCDDCSESFSTPSALFDHQQTSHIQNDSFGTTDDEDDEISDEQTLDSECEETEDCIPITGSNETNQPNVNILPNYMSPTQQRLTEALVYQPKFNCKINGCSQNFVFEDHLKSHSALHGEFLCSLCSHVEAYAPKLAEHVLSKHCTLVRDTYITCSISTCASSSSPVVFHQSNYVFHYLTEHLSLDVSSIGCPICHYIGSDDGNSKLNHFRTFHAIANMKPEDVFQCEFCPAFFCASNQLIWHTFAYHNKTLTSRPDCKQTFVDKNEFTDHCKNYEGRNRDMFQHHFSLPNSDKTLSTPYTHLDRNHLAHDDTCETIGEVDEICEDQGSKIDFETDLDTSFTTKDIDTQSPKKVVALDEEEFDAVLDPVKSKCRSPIPMTNVKVRRSTSNGLSKNRKRLRARRRFFCKKCFKPFPTYSGLLKHLETTHTEDKDDCDEEEIFVGETEEEIIQHYANTPFQFLQEHNRDRGKFRIVKDQLNAATNETEEPNETCIKTLSQCLSLAQQRLAAAVLHQPKFSCKINTCLEKFVFEDQLESHSKLHGEFVCSFCSHVEAYAPKLAEHILTQHCSTTSTTRIIGRFVSCPVNPCASSAPPLEIFERNYMFHYLTEHLNLDVSCIGCPICHHFNRVGALATHNHFQNFHGIFNMKAKHVRHCESCPAFFGASNKLYLHMFRFHNQFPTSCFDCNQTFEDRNWHEIHQKKCEWRKTNLIQHRCSFSNCDKECQSLMGLFVHRKYCAFKPEGIWYNCYKCPEQFRRKTQLHLHLESHKPKIKKINSTDFGETKECNGNKVCEEPDSEPETGFEPDMDASSLKGHIDSRSENCCNPIEIASEETNTLTSNAPESNRRVLRARKSYLCNECSESFTTPSALLDHQQTSHTHEDRNCDFELTNPKVFSKCVERGSMEIKNLLTGNVGRASKKLKKRKKKRFESSSSEESVEESDDELSEQVNSNTALIRHSGMQMENKRETEEEIIQHYANARLEFYRKNKNIPGKMLARPHPTITSDKTQTEKSSNSIINTLSEFLSPTQQRLTAALLHDPKFSCEIKYCLEKFVFQDQLETHSKLHGNFSCTLCSHVETYAPNLADHVLIKHCRLINSTKVAGTYVFCSMPLCASLPSPVEFHKSNYVFHYLTEHLNLDVSSLGCPICHYIRPVGEITAHNHFQHFHMVLKMKREDVRQCEMCPAFFCASSRLVLHMKLFHNMISSCPDCGKIFGNNRYGYIDHLKKCKGRKWDSFQHRCSFPNCNKTFERKNALVGHMKNCMLNAEGVWHNCSKCKKRYREEEQLHRHLESHKRTRDKMRRYNRGKKRMCEVCGKCISLTAYGTHMQYHAGRDTWKHVCHECGRKCINPGKLREHMRTHTKDVSFVCQFCGVKYAHVHNLRLHLSKKHVHDTPSRTNQSQDNPNPAAI